MVPRSGALLLLPGDALWTADTGAPVGDARLLRVTAPRFLQLPDVAEILNISAAQTYALVRSGELPAIKIGGRGQWRGGGGGGGGVLPPGGGPGREVRGGDPPRPGGRGG